MRLANILAGVATFLWAALFFIGLDGIYGVVRQHTSGYPNSGQIEYYVAFPGYMALGLLGCAWTLNGLRRWCLVQSLFSSAALLALLPYLVFYAGGI